MDHVTPLALTQLISNALSSVRSAKDIAKDSSDLELKDRISDAKDALLDLKEVALSQTE